MAEALSRARKSSRGAPITESVLAPGLHTSAETPQLTRSAYDRQRLLECVPATLLALCIVVPAVLLLVSATVAYVLFSAYLVFWLCQSLALALRQVRELRTFDRYKATDWDARLAHLSDPYERMHELAAMPKLSEGDAEELVALNHWVHSGPEVPLPDEVHHLIVMPISNEDGEIIHQSLDAVLATGFPAERMVMCLTFEERSLLWGPAEIEELAAEYRDRFGRFMTTRHPDGLPGESRVKGANISWGAQLARQELHRAGLRDEQVIVTTFDADTRPSKNYFHVLSYKHLTNPGRDLDIYQPVLLFHNNVWEVPVASRLVGYIASMWTLVDSTRPERLRIFSAHAMGMPALVSVNFWSKNVIPDDSRQFWRTFFATEGKSKTVPLHLPVYLDAVHADTWWNTMREQYRQIRRWSWGVIDFAYIMQRNLDSPTIPWKVKIVQTVRQITQFHFWATVALMVMMLRPITMYLQPYVVHSQFMLSDVAAISLLIAGVVSPIGLVITAFVALRLLPRRPAHRPKWTWIKMVGEFLLLPIVGPIFFCAPAIEAQIRLAMRKYLGFRVTVKSRTQEAHQVR